MRCPKCGKRNHALQNICLFCKTPLKGRDRIDTGTIDPPSIRSFNMPNTNSGNLAPPPVSLFHKTGLAKKEEPELKVEEKPVTTAPALDLRKWLIIGLVAITILVALGSIIYMWTSSGRDTSAGQCSICPGRKILWAWKS